MSEKTRNLILQRAIEWRRVASKKEEPFLKFIIGYIAFNTVLICIKFRNLWRRGGDLNPGGLNAHGLSRPAPSLARLPRH